MKAEISQARLKELLYYDEFTGHFTWLRPTSIRVKACSRAGKLAKRGGKKYLAMQVLGVESYVHRFVFLYMTGAWPPHQVDHADGNGLNNAWKNLSLATSGENATNTRLRSDNSSGCVGVFWSKNVGKWCAYIDSNKRRTYLGYSSSLFEIMCVRKTAEHALGFHKNHGSKRPL